MAEFLADDEEVQAAHKHTTYDLIANICHDGQPGMPVWWVWLVVIFLYFVGKGTYRVHARHTVSELVYTHGHVGVAYVCVNVTCTCVDMACRCVLDLQLPS